MPIINIKAKATIAPLTNPYKIPPTSLNCFNIGNFATVFASDITIESIILVTINIINTESI